MKKLAFIANCQTHLHNNQNHDANDAHDDRLNDQVSDQQVPVTQQYVAELLSKKLSEYGFETESTQGADWVSVHVDDHPVALGVSCRAQENGQLMCEINVQSDEDQGWFSKIETQSIVKQLTHAVENSLKADPAIKVGQWQE